MPEGFKLIGRKFVVNISRPSEAAGITVINRDPRKERYIPDAFPGVVEEVSEGCQLVRPGDRVVVQRFKWTQMDLDDQRLIASEKHLLIFGENLAAPGVCVMQLSKYVTQEQDLKLIVPDSVIEKKKRKTSYYYGRVISSGIFDIEPDMLLWVEKRETGQYFLNPEVLIFRNIPDSFNGDYPIFMIGEMDAKRN